MDSKLELTKSQLEIILRLINDVNLKNNQNGTKNDGKLISAKKEDRSAMKLTNRASGQTNKNTNLSKKRSLSAFNLNDTSNDELINESFRKSISKLLNNSIIDLNQKFPKIRTINQPNSRQLDEKQTPIKLKRNKSLIELKKEKWDIERNELKDSDSWYEKFDSLKKKNSCIDRSRSQPDMIINYEDNLLYSNRFDSESRLFSPVSNFDNESIALSNSYTARHSLLNPAHIDQFRNNQMNNQINSRLNGQINNQMSSRQSPSLTINQSPNLFRNDLINQPRKSFRRYAHSLNNIDILEKRRKQHEYQAQLDHQLAHKREQENIRKQYQMLEDRKFEEKILIDQAELRKEFEIDHGVDYLNKISNGVLKDRKAKVNKVDRKSTSELERLEMKSKELVKIFKEASTQTDEEMNRRENEIRQTSTQTNELMLDKWQSSSSMLQPVIIKNKSALLRKVTNNISGTRPKWIKQQSKSKDEDNRTSILPRLDNQKASQIQARKKWNS